MSTNSLLLGLFIVLVGGAAAAQTAVEVPRFNGSRTSASSAEVQTPSDDYPLVSPTNRELLNTLIEGAVTGAGREEDRNFAEKRRSKWNGTD